MRDHLADRLRRFADIADPESPLAARFARAAADDPITLSILDDTPDRVPAANVLLAAAHYLLLAGTPHDLAAHYPGIAGPVTTPPGDPGADFIAFCHEHRHTLAALAATRGVQTNEVRRCVALLPAFTRIARSSGHPLALLEVGASAGLNLCFDRYRYDYGFATAGPPSPLTLTTEVRRGRPPVAAEHPPVAWRIGIDLDPIALDDPDAVRWARALLWPEQVERAARFEAAVALVAPHPPTIVKGDAVAVTPSVAATAPDDAVLVVFHSYVLNQFTPDQRERFAGLLADLSHTRPVHQVAFESSRADIGSPELTHTIHDRGRATSTRLGEVHHHGAWITWDG